MKLRLLREPSSLAGATLGTLYINGVWECWTLEDEIQAVKVAGTTCIPAGTYIVQITPSQRFHRLMPQLIDVPGFEGIRIHAGNVTTDTNGCILVGQQRGVDMVLRSRLAFNALYDKLRSAEGPITITIENPECDHSR